MNFRSSAVCRKARRIIPDGPSCVKQLLDLRTCNAAKEERPLSVKRHRTAVALQEATEIAIRISATGWISHHGMGSIAPGFRQDRRSCNSRKTHAQLGGVTAETRQLVD